MENKNNSEKQITYSELKNGMQVVMAGHIFLVSKVEIGTINPNVVRFIGICTADKCNDEIRHRNYNGGMYTACADEECWINVPEATPQHKLSAYEQARFIRKRLKKNYSNLEDIANCLFISRSTARTRLELLEAPTYVVSALKKGTITPTHVITMVRNNRIRGIAYPTAFPAKAGKVSQ